MVWTILKNLRSLVSPPSRKRSSNAEPHDNKSPQKRAKTPNGMAERTTTTNARDTTPPVAESSLVADPAPPQHMDTTTPRQPYAQARFANRAPVQVPSQPQRRVLSTTQRQQQQPSIHDVAEDAVAGAVPTQGNAGVTHAYGLLTRVLEGAAAEMEANMKRVPSPGQRLQFTPYHNRPPRPFPMTPTYSLSEGRRMLQQRVQDTYAGYTLVHGTPPAPAAPPPTATQHPPLLDPTTTTNNVADTLTMDSHHVEDLEAKKQAAIQADRQAAKLRHASDQLLNRFAEMLRFGEASVLSEQVAQDVYERKVKQLEESGAAVRQRLGGLQEGVGGLQEGGAEAGVEVERRVDKQKKQKKQHKQQQQKQQQAKPPKHIEVITLSDDEEGCPTGSGSQGVLVYGAAVVDGIGGDGDGRQFKEEEEEVDVLVEYDFTVNKEEEQWARYKDVTTRGPAEEVLVDHEGSQIVLTRRDVRCMAAGQWLNDEVVNTFLGLLQERDTRRRTESKKGPTCHLWNTFFATKLYLNTREYDYSAVKRWTRPRSLKRWGQTSKHPLDCDLIFIPINYEKQHWAAALVWVKEHRVSYYDSLGGFNEPLVKAIAQWVTDEAANTLKQQIDTSSWTLDATDAPQQHNGCDCGMFMLAYAEHLSRGAPLDFSQKDMPWLRCLYTNQILNKRIE